MKSLVLAVAVIMVAISTVCWSEAKSTKISYALTASISNGRITLEHQITNKTDKSVCFYPSTIDVANAHFFDGTDKEIENIGTTGSITSQQTIYIARADGAPHAFVSSADISELIRSSSDTVNLRKITFDFYAYDCAEEVSAKYEGGSAVLHEKVSVHVKGPR